MRSLKNNNNSISIGNFKKERCFFCDCTNKLKSFKSFFICETCVNVANSISEENRK